VLTAVLVVIGLLAGTWLLADVTPVRPARGRAARADERGGPTVGDAAARVSVVVPARDEAATLPRLLGSLRALEPAPHEVIVVDDGSTDATAAVARAGGATLITAPPPPAGWLGKPWACQIGADAATGTHLLFLDADTWLAPDGLRRLLAEQAEHGGLLSVQPYHVTERPYEQLSAVFNVVSMMGTGAFAPRIGHPERHAAMAAAYGPCLLTSAADHAAVGGHGSVRGEVLEDVALAGRYRSAGRPVRCLAGGDAVGFRMYPGGVRQLVEGWTKNIAAGAGSIGLLALGGSVGWVMACAAVAAGAIGGVADWSGGAEPVPAPALAAWAVVAGQLWWMLRRIGSFRWWTAALFPVPLVAFLLIFARSSLLTVVRRQVTWRSRRVPVRARSARAR
jgi:hypothetical protein